MYRRPSPALVVSLLALFVALGGPAQAAKLITAKDVKRNSLTGKQVKNGSLALADLSKGSQTSLRRTPDGSVTGKQLAAAAVSSAQIAPNAVNGDRLADNAVSGTKVVDNSLTTNDIAANAVTADEVAPNSISSDEVAPNSLTGADIAAGAIGAAAVADGGLQTRDIGRFTGTVQLDFGVVPETECTSVATTSLTPVVADQNISDDVIVVTPAVSFPSDGVAVSAKPLGTNQIEVTVCNVQGPALLNVGLRSLRYVSIDAG